MESARTSTLKCIVAVLLLMAGSTAFDPVPGRCGEPADAPGQVTIQELWRAGEEAYERKDIEGALELFNRALEADPDQPRTWNYLGGVHFAKGDFLKALLHFKQAFALNPGDARACNNIGTAYEHLDQFDKAEQSYLRAIEVDPNYAVPYRNLGVLYADHLKRPKLARTYWERFLQLSPAGAEADAVREELERLEGAN